MTDKPPHLAALGLMSGTSLDGVDLALLHTDGRAYASSGGGMSVPYPEGLRNELRACLGARSFSAPGIRPVSQALTRFHADVIQRFLAQERMEPDAIDLIGFHGQTLSHEPETGHTLQIGHPQTLADLTAKPVIFDFRRRDVQSGGQGAPFLPVYHACRIRAADLPRPCAVVNIGGVANVTWIGDSPEDIIAFDTGPGNALLDDLIAEHTALSCDIDGKIAAEGRVDVNILHELMNHPFFGQKPPKSLDRNAWQPDIGRLSLSDAAATLTAFTAESIAAARHHFPAPARAWYVSGGGRHNPVLMQELNARLDGQALNIDTALGTADTTGDLLEAEGFAYLAVRSLLELPLSFPGTTGVPQPMTGGQLYKPRVKPHSVQETLYH